MDWSDISERVSERPRPATHITAAIDIAMKTTLEISDPLLREARRIAAHERTTLRALVEQGLRQVLHEKSKRKQFRLRDASFGAGGLRSELKGASWDRILELAYEGRAGDP
jgi:hypothetical protein